MCRSKDERVERCQCDTSEARRLRRHNSAARKLYAGLVSKIVPSKFLIQAIAEEPVTVEQIKEDIASLNDILETLLKPNINTTVVLMQYDTKLNKIGTSIEYLAEEKYNAPPDEQFRETANTIEIAFESYKKEALQKGMGDDAAHQWAEEKAFEECGFEVLEGVGNLLEKRNEAILRTLTDVGVEFANPDSLIYSEKSDESAINSLKLALKYYPQSWVDASNDKDDLYPLRIKESDTRAHYHPYFTVLKGFEIVDAYSELTVNEMSEFFVGEDAGMNTALHEFAHRVEHCVVGVTASEEIFLQRRAGHLPSANGIIEPEKLTDIYPDELVLDDDDHERGYKDNFPDHYMGKVYPKSDSREILSTGMEALFTGMYGGFTGIFKYSPDPDFKRFILGMLASSARTRFQ